MSRVHLQSSTPDYLTGDDLVTFLGMPNKLDGALSEQWKCSRCGTLYIFGEPTPVPSEVCRCCGDKVWKASQ